MKTHRVSQPVLDVAMLLGMAFALCSLARAEPPPINWDDWDVVPGRVIIKYKPEKATALRANPATTGIQGLSVAPLEEAVEKEFTAKNPGKTFVPLLPDTFVGTFDPEHRARILRALQADPDVEYFELERARITKPH